MWLTRAVLAATVAANAGSACAQESLTLRKIKESGVVALGYRDSSIPFSYVDPQLGPIGYTMDLCRHIVAAIAERLQMPGLEVKLIAVNSTTRIPMLTNSIIDLECGSTTNNAERQKQVAFTVTTYVASSRLVTRRAAKLKTLADLRGRKVVSTAGTTSMRQLVELNANRALNIQILVGRDHAESFAMVEADRAAAFMMDDVLLHGLVAGARNPSSFAVSEEAWSIEPYGIALRKDDPQFKKVADDALARLFTSSAIQKIYDRWFQSPIPPRNVNLRVPMSPALKGAIAKPTDSADPDAYRR